MTNNNKKRFFYPPAPGHGGDTFSDNLVGLQTTQGSPQMTLGNFSVTESAQAKQDREFTFGGFSGPITLEQLSAGDTKLLQTGVNNSLLIEFNYDNSDISKLVQYGSLKDRLRVAAQQIVNFFPAALYCSGFDKIYQTTGNTTESISYDSATDRTSIVVSKYKISNPFGVEVTIDGEIQLDNSLNMDYLIENPTTGNITTTSIQAQTGKVSHLRNFSLEYQKYSLSFSGSGSSEYNIVDYDPIEDGTKDLTIVISGSPFGTNPSPSTQQFYIKPNKLETQNEFNKFDSVEKFLLNQRSVPPYKAEIQILKQTEDGQNYQFKEELIWAKEDLWNIDVTTENYKNYLQKLVDVGDEIDDYKTNLVSRFLTTGALKDFDTGERKVEKTLQIYGRSFDDVKKFIDGIAFMNNVTYDGKNNVPNQLLRNFSKLLGWKTPYAGTQDQFLDTILDRYEPQYSGESIGITPVELDTEIYRRILMNTAYLFKSKGTRKAIEFILRFIGAPDALIEFNEYVMLADHKIKIGRAGFPVENERCNQLFSLLSAQNTDLTDEIKNQLASAGCYDLGKDGFLNKFAEISGGVATYPTYVYNPTDFTTSVEYITKSHNFIREDYPIDNEGYPTAPRETPYYYFQRGSGWFEETEEHHGEIIIDLDKSVMSGCTPKVVTKMNQFSWGGFFGNLPPGVSSNDPGAPYLERFRKFPYLDMGFGLTRIIDDKKSWARVDKIHEERNYEFEGVRYASYNVTDERYVINVKNVDIFLNIGQALVYEVWQQSILSGCPFSGGPLPPPYPQGGGVDNTVTLINAKDYSFKEFSHTFWKSFINVRNRQTIDDGKTGGYPLLQQLYLDYLSEKCGANNQYTYQKMVNYAQSLGTYWIRIIEQLVPATTLWQGGVKVENSIFHRDKFVYKHYPIRPLDGFGSKLSNKVQGCTAPSAANYNPLAEENDDSCVYADSFSRFGYFSSVVDPNTGSTCSSGCQNTGGTRTVISDKNSAGTLLTTTPSCVCCVPPENSMVLQMRPLSASCKSTWPSFKDYNGVSANTSNAGVNNSINNATSKFASNDPEINGAYNLLSVVNNNIMFSVKKTLPLSKNKKEPWGYVFRLPNKNKVLN
tara:strand:- start:4828 stop:8142 length:3315 start_codon:yes stop_codon:yes gene_type:complete